MKQYDVIQEFVTLNSHIVSYRRTPCTAVCFCNVEKTIKRLLMAATRKQEKYVDLGARYIFEPIAVETLCVFNASARHQGHLLDDLGRRISENTGKARGIRNSILVQRFNAVLLHDSLTAYRLHILMIVPNFVFTY